eukprot:Em0015g1123a
MIRRVFVTVLLFATANTVDLDSQKRDKVCDDGIHLIEKDLGDGPNWNCQGTNIIIETFYTPSGYASCQDPLQVSETFVGLSEPHPLLLYVCQASFVCMDADITYSDTPPSRTEAAIWIRSHALQTQLSTLSSNGVYKSGLLHNATVLPGDVICPDLVLSHATKGSGVKENVAIHVATPAISIPVRSCDPTCPTPLVPLPQSHLFSLQTLLVYALFAFLVVLLVAILMVILAYMVRGCKTNKRGHSRYKPASSFFSLGTGSKEKAARVSIPEVGVPSPMPNEREILLNADSDEEL